MATILVVDDDAHIREVIHYALAQEGHAVELAGDGAAAWTRVQAGGIDLLVLDVLMPGMDGLTLCRRLRATEDGGPPIVFLSSRGEEFDRVLGLELGGDDYLPKPFGPRELVTRVNAVLRRARRASPSGAAAADARIAHGAVALDTARHEASVNGVRVELTVTEFAILRTLFEARGRVLTRGQLIDSVRDADTHITERTVDTHVRRIRAKLRPHGLDPIETVHGLGYKAAAPPT
ncbi:MAG TPA: response regulator transcription factor [Polyangia bacterium]|jgi:two-component system OmpR family response regulator